MSASRNTPPRPASPFGWRPATGPRHAAQRPGRQPRGLVAEQITVRYFQTFSHSEGWQPAVNLYRLERRLEMCVDLAGIDPDALQLLVEPKRVLLRGVRDVAEPKPESGETMFIEALEIDHGPFAREVRLPRRVDPSQVRTAYERGLLWIQLPLAEHA